MKIGEAIKAGKDILKDVSDAPLLEAEVLFSFVSGKSKEFIMARYDCSVPEGTVKKFFALVQKRKKGIPLPYITHFREFMGLNFFVNRNVLIPRQETEALVEEALRVSNNKKMYVLDVGTGSGCILVSFLYYNKLSSGIGIDISQRAINVALKNSERLNVSKRVRFVVSDFRNFVSEKKFDMIFSNPPYVRSDEVSQVRYEPRVALLGGKDGTEIYPELTAKAFSLLKPGGVFITEIDYRSADKVVKIFEKAGFGGIRAINDYTHRIRFLEGVK